MIFRNLLDFFALTVSRSIERALADIDLSEQIPLNDRASLEPETFYREFGFLTGDTAKILLLLLCLTYYIVQPFS